MAQPSLSLAERINAMPSLCLARRRQAMPLRCTAKQCPEAPRLALQCLCRAKHHTATPSLCCALRCQARVRHALPRLCCAKPYKATPLPCPAQARQAVSHLAFAELFTALLCKDQRFIAFALPGMAPTCLAVQCHRDTEQYRAPHSFAFAMRSIALQRFTLPSPHAASRRFAFAVLITAMPDPCLAWPCRDRPCPAGRCRCRA